MSTYAEIDATLTAPGQFFEIERSTFVGCRPAYGRARRARCASCWNSRGSGCDTPFLVLGDERVTHGEHYARVAAFAQRLVDDFGVRPGDRVVIAMRNYPEWSVAFFAATAVGAVAVPLNAFWTGERAGVRGHRLRRTCRWSPTANGSTRLAPPTFDELGDATRSSAFDSTTGRAASSLPPA